MTENELARALFGRREREARESGGTTITVTATATADSADGMVAVDFGTDIIGDDKVADPETGEVVYAPPSQSVEVPVAGGVSAGDTVSVLIVDGTPVQAIGTGSVDRVGAVADSAKTTADEAAAVAAAVGQHFWHDTRGAHVTEEKREDYETQASGFQQLMTSIGTLLTRAVNGIEYLLRSDTQSGMAIYDGTCTADDANLAQHMVASFTAQGAQIGTKDNAHVEMDTNSFNMVDKDSSTFFSADDLRDETGVARLIETFRGNGTQTVFSVTQEIDSIASVTVGGVETTNYTFEYFAVTLATPPASGTSVVIRYYTRSLVTAFTLGQRRNNSAIGVNSIVAGYYCEASGQESFASGYATEATANCAHAEGYETTARGSVSHTEGNNTIASSNYQHVQGKYNIEDTQNKYAHIVGNGTSDNSRSNAHTVDWNGYGWYQGDVSCGGTSGDAPIHSLSGAAAAAAAAQTTADTVAGDAYRKSGNNVVVGGQTIGTADNLSYVASESTLRAPTTGVPTPIGSAVGSSYIYWAKVGRLVMVNGSLRADQANANQRLMSGFPIPWTGTGVTSVVRAAAMKERTGGIYQAMINANGEIVFDALTGGTGWYLFNFCYLAAS